MSSSRSIAAARNRRAGEQQQPQINRPGTSIAGQPAFSQQNKKGSTIPTNAANQPIPNSTPNVQTISAKLSISDAIGLITLRLGRVEQILMDFEHNGGFNSSSTILPDNTHLVDKSVINSIVNRLDSLEKKEKESSSNQHPSKSEGEIRDIKDLLMSQILKYEKFTSETNKKFDELNETIAEYKNTFDDFDQAINDIEKKQEQFECATKSSDACVSTDNIVLNENINVNVNEPIYSNLKNIIEQELIYA